ncbi:MAG: hypothetical protein R3A79_09245 [Nannocystaceae bacterium]
MTIRRLLTISTLALALATPAPASAAPSRKDKAKDASRAAEEADEATIVERALKEWASGNWVGVRSLLEPLVSGGLALQDPLLTESALRYLTDATLLDDSLDPQIRAQLATGYISRLFAADPEWRPPPDTHGQPLYDLYNQLREANERAKLDECRAERASCDADLDDLKVRHARLRGDHESLKKAFGEQEVEVREKVARNRAIALLPFGIGHFYNGRKGLGAGFLAAEALTGGIGLGLLLYRNYQCDRTAGFAPESLQCNATNAKALLARRDAEQALGIGFISLLAVDVLIAQLTFEPYATIKTERVKRSVLEAEEAQAPGAEGPRTNGPRQRKQSRGRARDNLQARPHPAVFRGGAGAGLTLRF